MKQRKKKKKNQFLTQIFVFCRGDKNNTSSFFSFSLFTLFIVHIDWTRLDCCQKVKWKIYRLSAEQRKKNWSRRKYFEFRSEVCVRQWKSNEIYVLSCSSSFAISWQNWNNKKKKVSSWNNRTEWKSHTIECHYWRVIGGWWWDPFHRLLSTRSDLWCVYNATNIICSVEFASVVNR